MMPTTIPGIAFGHQTTRTMIAATAAMPSPATQLIANAPSQWSASPRSNASPHEGQRDAILSHEGHMPAAPQRGQ